jgi:hypothetical protein
MKSPMIPFKPLLAALALVLATTACQQRDDTLATPANDAATIPPADPVDTTTVPPMQQEIDPCAGLMGTELDECLRRQNEMATPPIMEETQPMPPTDTPPVNDPATTPPPGN